MRLTSTDWEQHIEAQRASDLSIKAYCAQEFLNCRSFYYWRHQFQKKHRPTFVPVHITDIPPVENNKAVCKLTLKHGRCLEFYDRAFVKELFRECV